MTPSDRDPNASGPAEPPGKADPAGAANPFDTGLPMLRLPPPTASKSKRKRKRQAGRVIGRNIGAARPEPGVIDSSGNAGEPVPPLPVPEQARPSGDWAQWLEPRASASAEDNSAEDGSAGDDDRYAGHDHGAAGFADTGTRTDASDRDARDPYEYHLDDPATDETGDRTSPAERADDDAFDRFDRRYATANVFDENEPDEPERLPSLIDRTGGNPGPGLRRPRRQGSGDTGKGSDRLLAVLVVVGVLIAVGSIVWAVLPSSPPARVAEEPTAEQAVPAPVPTTVAPDVSRLATPGCEQRNSAEVVSGTDPGGTTDGPSAILAFEHAYYVLRSGAAARAVVTPDSTVPDAAQIQRGIDQVPVGTRYCVHITKSQAPSADGLTRWEVRLTQQYPDEEPKTFLQSIATRSHTGKTLIASISMA